MNNTKINTNFWLEELKNNKKKTMKALGKLQKAPGLTLYEAPLPTMNDDDVLIKIIKTSICGTDLNIYKWDEWAQKTIPVPMTVGHEFVGKVIKVGKNVKHISVGDRVSAEGHIICGTCSSCRSLYPHHCPNTKGIGVNRTGSFAEYLSIPASNAIKLPDSISDDVASILDPLGNAVHTTLSFPLIGQHILITGAGPIGIMAADIAKFVGAKTVTITDISPYRLELAKKSKADRIVDVSKEDLKQVMLSMGINEGYNVGLEMSGSELAFNQMVDLMACGGKIALLGILKNQIGINWINVVFKSLFIKGIYGREIFNTWQQMISLLENGLDPSYIITHKYKIDDYEKGFEVMKAGNSGKVILEWV